MLLEVDGLDSPWDGVNVPTSEWEGNLGNLDEDDVPLALTRILWPSEIRAYDTSRVGEHLEQEESGDLSDEEHLEQEESNYLSDEDENSESDSEVRYVRNLSLNYFRAKLVEHFDIKFWQHQVVWPRRRGALPHENILS